MKKNIILLALGSTFFLGGIAHADNHSISLGYAESMVKHFEHIKGVNAQYRYEWDSPLSVVGTVTYMSGSDVQRYFYADDDYAVTAKNDIDAKYYSLLVGPAYRINELFSFYALVGVSHVKVKQDAKFSDGSQAHADDKSTNFTYGAGMIVNPVENFVVTVGYEGNKLNVADEHSSINGFNIGVGYRF